MVYKKYSLHAYDKNYPRMFYRERLKLKKILSKDIAIEHIGSTAVPYLKGKDIIDIVIMTKGSLNKIKNDLVAHRYLFKSSGGDTERLFFKKPFRFNGRQYLAHIHVTPNRCKVFSNMVAVRDYLRCHPEECRNYEDIKREAINFANNDGMKYRQYKDTYLRSLITKSLKFYKSHPHI
jgi:GrpB-like predicted nucleotidyltransferase (UPF0157 family)